MTAGQPQFAGADQMAPADLRALAEKVSRALESEADALIEGRLSQGRRAVRDLLAAGFNEDTAERDGMAIKNAMIRAARALVEAAQEVDVIATVLDGRADTLRDGPGAR